jgi:alkylation response protein AidB-like acyl-CoA dehydrogenase
MQFDFSEDQLLLQRTVREFLEGECTVEFVRGLWQTETGHSPEFWARFAEIGVPGLLVPEEHGGLGMDEIDLVLLLEEAGRAALPEPVIATAAVGVPLIAGTGSPDLCERWLPKVASGEAILAVGHSLSPFVSDAHVAGLLLLQSGDEVHAVSPEAVALTHQPSNDPSRRLASVAWTPAPKTRVAKGSGGRALWSAAVDRGALGCAAQQLGVGQQLIDMAVAYACERRQFGVPIGSFQAIKHMLADVVVRVEYARSVVYRAAHSVARDVKSRSVDVSAAKVAASEAAVTAAKTALQVYGALGYTWEQDLHIWMRRAWSFDLAWGDGAWHRARVADAVIDGALPAETFGYSATAA